MGWLRGRKGKETGDEMGKPRGAAVPSGAVREGGGGGAQPFTSVAFSLSADREGRGGGRGIAGEGGTCRSVSPRCRAEQLQSAGERAVGQTLRGQRALRGAAAGERGARPPPRRGQERTPRRRGTARRGSSPPRAPGPAVGLPPGFILSFNLFFPFDPLGFFSPSLSCRASPRPQFPPSLASLDFFLLILLF